MASIIIFLISDWRSCVPLTGGRCGCGRRRMSPASSSTPPWCLATCLTATWSWSSHSQTQVKNKLPLSYELYIKLFHKLCFLSWVLSYAFNNIKLYIELLEPLARTLWNNFWELLKSLTSRITTYSMMWQMSIENIRWLPEIVQLLIIILMITSNLYLAWISLRDNQWIGKI